MTTYNYLQRDFKLRLLIVVVGNPVKLISKVYLLCLLSSAFAFRISHSSIVDLGEPIPIYTTLLPWNSLCNELEASIYRQEFGPLARCTTLAPNGPTKLSNSSCVPHDPRCHASLSASPLHLTRKSLLHYEVLELGRVA